MPHVALPVLQVVRGWQMLRSPVRTAYPSSSASAASREPTASRKRNFSSCFAVCGLARVDVGGDDGHRPVRPGDVDLEPAAGVGELDRPDVAADAQRRLASEDGDAGVTLRAAPARARRATPRGRRRSRTSRSWLLAGPDLLEGDDVGLLRGEPASPPRRAAARIPLTLAEMSSDENRLVNGWVRRVQRQSRPKRSRV